MFGTFSHRHRGKKKVFYSGQNFPAFPPEGAFLKRKKMKKKEKANKEREVLLYQGGDKPLAPRAIFGSGPAYVA